MAATLNYTENKLCVEGSTKLFTKYKTPYQTLLIWLALMIVLLYII